MLPKIAQSKVGNLLYGAVVRVIAQGQNKERSQHIFTTLSDAVIMATRSEYNSLMVLPNGGYPFEHHIACVYGRSSCRLGMVLNAAELSTLVHIPSASVVSGKLVRNVIKSKPLPHALTDGRYALGVSTHLGKEELVWVTDQERLRHMHIIGATGTGKSTFIVNLVLQDCDAGNGCIVFDPHGDLIDDILPRIGPERMEDVILIDPSDTEYPIGFNLLEAKTELEKIILSSDLVETFKEKSTAWGDTMSAVLTNAINAFLESERGGTLLELRKFLLDTKFRHTVLVGITDPAIHSYWQQEFHQLKKGSLSPLLTRIDTFLRPKIIRNMMAQKQGLDFDGILAGNKIVLVKLSQGLIGRENSYMLGTLFLAKLYQAAQARQAVGKSERTPFYCYIDECQHYITPSLGEILSGARKYSLGLILAHQDLRQIQDTTIGNSILSNPAIRLCFRVGYADAQQLEKGFSFFDPTDLQNLSTGEAIGRVERNDWDFYIVGDVLPDSIYEPDNVAIAKEQTQKQYATPVADVENIIAELYQFTPVEPKEKKEVKKVQERSAEPKPAEPTPVVENSIEQETINPVAVELPPVDIESASEKYREQAEKARQKREHLHLQDFIKKLAEQRGFKVTLEAPAPSGGRIDALLVRNELSIACELSVTNTIEYEVKNLQKCLDAGYEHIVMLCSNETHLRNIKQAASEAIDVNNVQFINPEHLHVLLDSFEPKMNTKETRTKGYRIKTTYNVESENQGTDETVKATLREALKRKK